MGLEQQFHRLEERQKTYVSRKDGAKELVESFMNSAGSNRELLVNLIERIELTADKKLIIKFRFPDQAETNIREICDIRIQK